MAPACANLERLRFVSFTGSQNIILQVFSLTHLTVYPLGGGVGRAGGASETL